jgi:hypothetical protein
MDLTRGGAKGTRTPNPLLAKQVRYQLRHGPVVTVGSSRRASCDRVCRPHQVSAPPCVCTVCPIRFAAPSTACWAMVPTRWPYTSLVIAMLACPMSLETTAISAPLATVPPRRWAYSPQHHVEWLDVGSAGQLRPSLGSASSAALRVLKPSHRAAGA